MTKRLWLQGLIFGLACTGIACSSDASGGSGSDSFTAMFDTPPGKATPDRVTGLWGGGLDRSGVRFDMRLRVEDGRLVVASRCRWSDGGVLTVGAIAASRIAEKPAGDISCFPLDPGGPASKCGDLEVLESKSDRQQDGDRWCAIDLHPEAYEWTMSGVKLRFSLNGELVNLLKISD